MKKFVILFSTLIIFLSINVSATAYDTIYVDEEAVISGDGGTAQTPLKSLHTALLQVNNNGKLIVKNTALLKLQPGEINEGVRIDKNIIIEGGENGFIVSRDKLSLYGDVVFRNIRFQFSGTESDKRKIYVNGNNLTMDNVTIPEKTSEGIEIKIFPTIYGGGINPTNKNATINLNSGVFENIYAGSDVSTYSGNVDINFSGRAKISAPVGFVNGIDGGNVNGDVNISVSNMNNEVKHFKGGTGSGNKKITFNNYGNGPVSPYILRDFNDVVLGSNVYLAKKDSTQDFGNISNLTVSQSSTLEVSDDFSIAGNFIGGGIVKIAKVKKLNIGGKVFGETEFKMQLNDEEPTVNTAYITANGGGDGTFLYAKPIGTSFTGTGLVKSDGIPTTWKVGEYARTITKSEFNGAKTIDASSPYQNERTYSLACFDQYNVKFFVPTEFKIKEAEYADKVKIIPVGLSVILEIGPYITLPATVTLEAIVTLPNGTFYKTNTAINIVRSLPLQKLSVPTNLRWDESRILRWDVTPNADFYDVSIYENVNGIWKATPVITRTVTFENLDVFSLISYDNTKAYRVEVKANVNLYNKFMPSDSAMSPVYGTIQSGGVVIEKGIDNTLVKVNLKGDFETMVCLIKYKGDTLLDAKTDTKVLTSETTEFRLTIPNKKVDETIKLFIWNAKNLTPISVPQVIE